MNVLICGICGKMGTALKELIAADELMKVACGVDIKACENQLVPVYASFNDVKEKIDVVIDFSSPATLAEELQWAKRNNCPLVLATTGYSEEQLKLIDKYSESIAVFRTANFSLGVNLLCSLVRSAAAALGENFDIEIIEKHHNQKVDAPSGTALMLADSANSAFDGEKQYVNGRQGAVGKRGKEIGIHAVRGGTIVGEHDVLFAGDDEIITLSHSASSKKVFAAGALRAAKFMVGKSAGKYDMGDIFKNL